MLYRKALREQVLPHLHDKLQQAGVQATVIEGGAGKASAAAGNMLPWIEMFGALLALVPGTGNALACKAQPCLHLKTTGCSECDLSCCGCRCCCHSLAHMGALVLLHFCRQGSRVAVYRPAAHQCRQGQSHALHAAAAGF